MWWILLVWFFLSACVGIFAHTRKVMGGFIGGTLVSLVVSPLVGVLLVFLLVASNNNKNNINSDKKSVREWIKENETKALLIFVFCGGFLLLMIMAAIPDKDQNNGYLPQTITSSSIGTQNNSNADEKTSSSTISLPEVIKNFSYYSNKPEISFTGTVANLIQSDPKYPNFGNNIMIQDGDYLGFIFNISNSDFSNITGGDVVKVSCNLIGQDKSNGDPDNKTEIRIYKPISVTPVIKITDTYPFVSIKNLNLNAKDYRDQKISTRGVVKNVVESTDDSFDLLLGDSIIITDGTYTARVILYERNDPTEINWSRADSLETLRQWNEGNEADIRGIVEGQDTATQVRIKLVDKNSINAHY